MNMQRIAISELSEQVRLFLAQVRAGEGIVIEDESGRSQYGIIPYSEATTSERAYAWKKLEVLQQKVGQAMTQAGVTEADIEKALLQVD